MLMISGTNRCRRRVGRSVTGVQAASHGRRAARPRTRIRARLPSAWRSRPPPGVNVVDVLRHPTTPQRLRLARAVLVVVAVLTGLTGTVVAEQAPGSVGRIDNRTVRALVATRQAHAYLVDADRVAIHSFGNDDVLLGGPGQRYQDAVTGASRAIEQLAETLGGGPDDQQLPAINAELVTYMGLIEQADAAHRAEAARRDGTPPAGLGRAYLWYASSILHRPGSGLLARVDRLGEAQEHALEARTWWLGVPAMLGFLVLGGCLLGCLAATQVWMLRRFRRILNLPLALATACALLVCGWTLVDLAHVQHGYASAMDTTVEPLLGVWRIRAAAAEADGQSAMATVLAIQCPAAAPCQDTVRALGEATDRAATTAQSLPEALPGPGRAALARTLMASRSVRDAVAARNLAAAATRSQHGDTTFTTFDTDLLDRIQALDRSRQEQMQAAQHVPGLVVGVPILSVLIVALAGLGVRNRLEEYQTSRRAPA